MANVLTQVGEEWMVDLLNATVSNQTSFTQYVAWGTGAGTAAKGDTTLFTEAAETRVSSTRTEGATADIVKHVATITCAGSGKTITNAGLFTALTVGILILKGDFTGIPLNVGDKIEFTMTLEIA